MFPGACRLMTPIYALGTAAVDFRIVTPDFGDSWRDKLLAREVLPLNGGSAANALAAVTAAGGRACYLGRLGNDEIGDRILEGLRAYGISTELTLRRQGELSPFNLAVYAGESRRRIGGWLLPNSLRTLDGEALEFWETRLQPGAWCLVEVGEIPVPFLIRFLRMAKELGVKTVLDIDLDPVRQCGASPEEWRSLAQLADLLAPNRETLRSLYPADHLAESLYREFRIPAVVTAGNEGAYYFDAKGGGRVPAPEVEAVDTVGAGDAFHGGLLVGLSQEKTLPEAVALGCAFGAEACTWRGARKPLE